jgi:hypothetical protein
MTALLNRTLSASSLSIFSSSSSESSITSALLLETAISSQLESTRNQHSQFLSRTIIDRLVVIIIYHPLLYGPLFGTLHVLSTTTHAVRVSRGFLALALPRHSRFTFLLLFWSSRFLVVVEQIIIPALLLLFSLGFFVLGGIVLPLSGPQCGFLAGLSSFICKRKSLTLKFFQSCSLKDCSVKKKKSVVKSRC